MDDYREGSGVTDEQSSIRRPRCRELGIEPGFLPTGAFNAITDVPGVLVGEETLICGDGPLQPGIGPVRTGVTVILPHKGNMFLDRVPASVFVMNGFGKCLGTEQVEELGVLETPIALTSTLSVPRVADGLITHAIRHNPDMGIEMPTVNPFIGECNDSYLNDAQGRHVGERATLAAIASAASGLVAEGAVGAGTGMSAFGFKGGIGTSSRVVPDEFGGWTVGVLVLANFGSRHQLVIDGVPVGRLLEANVDLQEERGSIMMIVAMNAPLLDRALKRVAKRATLGLARTGSIAGHGSGDVVVAFSNSPGVRQPFATQSLTLPLEIVAESGIGGSTAAIDTIFQATVEATEEAILNALFRARTIVGRDGHVREAIPLAPVVQIMRNAGREVTLPDWAV